VSTSKSYHWMQIHTKCIICNPIDHLHIQNLILKLYLYICINIEHLMWLTGNILLLLGIYNGVSVMYVLVCHLYGLPITITVFALMFSPTCPKAKIYHTRLYQVHLASILVVIGLDCIGIERWQSSRKTTCLKPGTSKTGFRQVKIMKEFVWTPVF
jgi:hypothetical protein